MIITIKFKKDIANICVFYIIISKFGYYQKFNPVILLKIDKNLKVNFYNTILLIYLAISLLVKSY